MKTVIVCVGFYLCGLAPLCSGLNLYERNRRIKEIKLKSNSLFEKIVNKEVPCDFLFEDEHCVAFNDIQPQAPAHFIILPKKKIISLSLASDSDAQLLGHMMIVAKKVAAVMMLNSYRVVVNSGKDASQMTAHLHLHVLGGRVMHWPPG